MALNFCSEDNMNQAVVTCFCQFPLTFVCSEHLYKHQMNTDYFNHFHLPVYAREFMNSEAIKDRYRQWLFGLHSAYTVLNRNVSYIARFEDDLSKLYAVLKEQFLSEFDQLYTETKAKLIALRTDFQRELESAINTVSQHAIENWTPPPESLSELIWNYDAQNTEKFKLFSLGARECARPAFEVSIKTTYQKLSAYNQSFESTEAKGLKITIEKLRQELSDAQQIIAQLTEENARMVAEVNSWRKSNAQMADELAHLRSENQELMIFATEVQGENERQQDLVKAKEKEMLTSEFNIHSQVHQIAIQAIPYITGNNLSLYHVTTGRMTSSFLSVSFPRNTMLVHINSDTVLCVGFSPASTEAWTVSIPTSTVTKENSMLVVRFVPGLIKYGDYVYVFGGKDNLASCEKFAIDSRTWLRVPNMSTPRCNFTPCGLRDNIYLPEAYYSDYRLEKFNVASEHYTTLNVPMNGLKGESVGFFVGYELVLITAKKQIGRWEYGKETGFKVSDIAMETGWVLSNSQPVQIGKEMMWRLYDANSVVRFNVDRMTFV